MKCCGNVDWHVAQSNAGNSFDMSTGIFTAPVSGLYLFSISALANGQQNNQLTLQKNNFAVGSAWGKAKQDTMSIHSTLQLTKGDQISANLIQGGLFDDSNRVSHFSGTLLEQSQIGISEKAWTYASKSQSGNSYVSSSSSISSSSSSSSSSSAAY